MEVEKTVSPNTLVGAPKALPAKDCPVLRWSTAGTLGDSEAYVLTLDVKGTVAWRKRRMNDMVWFLQLAMEKI